MTISDAGEITTQGPQGPLEAWSRNHQGGGWLLTFFWVSAPG